MDPIQDEEWHTLQTEAQELIYGSYDLDELCLVRVIVAPSFDTLENWRLIRRNTPGAEGFFVQWIHWDQQRDLERVMAPTGMLPVERRYRRRVLEPTVITGEAELALETAEALLQRLAHLAVPCLAPEDHGGLDGTIYYLRTGWGSCGVEYSWWQTPPAPWLPLMEATEDMLRAFRRLAGT